jgi:hypothetical protein
MAALLPARILFVSATATRPTGAVSTIARSRCSDGNGRRGGSPGSAAAAWRPTKGSSWLFNTGIWSQGLPMIRGSRASPVGIGA